MQAMAKLIQMADFGRIAARQPWGRKMTEWLF
ncbi:hypothetical protein X766_30025 [Mesorhizobium sp. LSJC255A00]|nr:hypothetical protein X766_30025 [Mesorhizobium sp. LSJC255A00]